MIQAKVAKKAGRMSKQTAPIEQQLEAAAALHTDEAATLDAAIQAILPPPARIPPAPSSTGSTNNARSGTGSTSSGTDNDDRLLEEDEYPATATGGFAPGQRLLLSPRESRISRRAG